MSACEHDVDAEYLYASDVEVIDLFGHGDGVEVRLAFPCPDCERALEAEVPIRSGRLSESDLELTPGDAEDVYD